MSETKSSIHNTLLTKNDDSCSFPLMQKAPLTYSPPVATVIKSEATSISLNTSSMLFGLDPSTRAAGEIDATNVAAVIILINSRLLILDINAPFPRNPAQASPQNGQ